jgi:phosphosulfolactate synthase (CoM biosynthesis protein A)
MLSFKNNIRPVKPRKHGMTSVIDFGPDTFGWTSPNALADYLECTAEYIDYAKIYAMNALLLPADVVKRVIGIYKNANIIPYAGGILFEYACLKNELDDYIRHLKKLGMPQLEVSENYLELTDKQRMQMIDRMHAEGFKVIYEFGRKNPTEPFSADILENIILSNHAAGVEHTIIEQSEIDFVSAHDPTVLNQIVSSSWFSHVFIEADPYAFPKGHVGLLEKFGSNVNLANITADQVLRLQGFRYGIGRAVNYSILTES